MKKISYVCLSFFVIFSLCIINTLGSNSKNNTSSIPTSNISKDKKIYLTFDDGPSENTMKILEILNEYEVPATFFVTGPSYKLKNDLLQEILIEGHTLGIHSYNHIYSQIYNSKESYLNDFISCLNWIKENTNSSPSLYRFPGGSSNTIASKSLIQEIISDLEKQNYIHVDWNVDSLDSKYNSDYNQIINITIDTIKKNEANNIYNQIILLHDNTKKVGTLKALPSIIEYGLSHDYQFEILSIDSPLIQHVKKPIPGL